MTSLSLITHTLNEAEFIGDCLRQIVGKVDEIIVIDHGSKDGTLDVLEQFPIHIHHTGGENFLTKGEQYFRDLAASMCRTDWMLALDGDEILNDDWDKFARPWLNENGNNFGAIAVRSYHMMGSYQYHSKNGHRFHRFVRKHPGLRGCPPMQGSKCHSFYHQTYDPPLLHYMPEVELFHCGYVKRDLAGKLQFNIQRGDFSEDPDWQREACARVAADPVATFGQCVPMNLPPERYPAPLRPKLDMYEVEYDATAERLLSRRLKA